MADITGNKDAKDFGIGIHPEQKGFFLKGANQLDWGIQDRLSRIFNPHSGKTVMLAFDHGYFMGPTSGLERIDLSIGPLVNYTDVLMCTRGALRTSIPSDSNRPVVLRCSAGASILKELSDECIGVAIDDAIRLNVSAMAVQVFIGGPHEHESISNLVRLIDAGMQYGIPTLGVTAVGKELTRDARYLGLATRIIAELGAQFVKTYYCAENFDEVVAGCPVPIVIAGGKKLPERDALAMARNAIDQGALGVDMGRNIFQAENPVAMIQAVRSVVHDGVDPDTAFDLYESLKADIA